MNDILSLLLASLESEERHAELNPFSCYEAMMDELNQACEQDFGPRNDEPFLLIGNGEPNYLPVPYQPEVTPTPDPPIDLVFIEVVVVPVEPTPKSITVKFNNGVKEDYEGTSYEPVKHYSGSFTIYREIGGELVRVADVSQVKSIKVNF